MGRRFGIGALCALALVSLSVLWLIPRADAEVAREGDVTVAFHGDLAPQKLPRAGKAPVTVRIGEIGRAHV